MLPRPVTLLALLAALAHADEQRGDAPDSPPRSPEAERATFHLPPGFEIQLVADESQIQKPMNLNFDAAGRLWVTGSALYPFAARTDAVGQPIDSWEHEWSTMSGSIGKDKPAPPAAPIDTVRVLSDFGPDGRARKVEVFADKLNVPIGIQPLPRKPSAKGDTIIVYSIPTIWRMEDTDGDGRADVREPLYTGFGFRDTHGMSSNYLYWIDGWIYGCHGFANHSEVRDRAGHVTVLDSGNTYRFRPDGSAFEIYTHGQTNPFGLTVDPLGNFYSADSHSKPAYLLIRGGYYEGIGKKHDGLGFAPAMMQHSHGSSAIAGIAYYADDKWPEEYRGNLFIGNPVTRRIDRDRLEWHGSTPKAIEMPDFLTCDDPWFRPVQVKLGPDGALWIADFYNPVIGHYEFPLLDPRRDHSHGRVWRIVWRGHATTMAPPPNLAQLDPTALKAKLQDANVVVRALASHQLGIAPATPATAPRESMETLLDRWSTTSAEDLVATYTTRIRLRDCLLAEGYARVPDLVAKRPEDAARIAEISLAVPNADSAAYLLGFISRDSLHSARTADYLRHVIRFLPSSRLPAVAELLTKQAASVATAAAVAEAAREREDPIPAALVAWTRRTLIEALSSPNLAEQDAAIAALRESRDAAKLEGLRQIVETAHSDARRAAALEALGNLPEADDVTIRALHDSASPLLRKKAAELLGARLASSGSASARPLLDALATAPTELAGTIATALAKTDESAAQLLDAIDQGKASRTLLRQKAVAAALANRPAALRERATALTKDLPPEDARLDKVIAARVAVYGKAKPDPSHGKALFQQHCAVCHKFHGEGGSVAPNLDGVGPARGVHRLAEDILDPNRNVDGTFRQVLVETKSGQMFAGVNLRQTPTAVTLTDATAKDVTIARADIKSQTTSPLSLMPPAFEQTIPENEFADLLAYLLAP